VFVTLPVAAAGKLLSWDLSDLLTQARNSVWPLLVHDMLRLCYAVLCCAVLCCAVPVSEAGKLLSWELADLPPQARERQSSRAFAESGEDSDEGSDGEGPIFRGGACKWVGARHSIDLCAAV
jgi:hypothetical protein